MNKIVVDKVNKHNTAAIKRNLDHFKGNNNSDYNSLIEIFDTEELIIYGLTISNNNFDLKSIFLHVKNVNKVIIKNLEISKNVLK